MDAEWISRANRCVGQRLRALRLLRGLTQAQLGQQLGVSFQQIQKYEKGGNTISAGRLFYLARVLQVAPDVFFEGLDTQEAVALPEGRQEWLKLSAIAASLRSPKLRQAIKSFILDARKIEQQFQDSRAKDSGP